MVRLVRLVKIYKVSANRAQRKRKEAELLEVYIHAIICPHPYSLFLLPTHNHAHVQPSISQLTKKGVITLEEYTHRLLQTDTENESRVRVGVDASLLSRLETIQRWSCGYGEASIYVYADGMEYSLASLIQALVLLCSSLTPKPGANMTGWCRAQ